jgi:hypothetical protein
MQPRIVCIMHISRIDRSPALWHPAASPAPLSRFRLRITPPITSSAGSAFRVVALPRRRSGDDRDPAPPSSVLATYRQYNERTGYGQLVRCPEADTYTVLRSTTSGTSYTSTPLARQRPVWIRPSAQTLPITTSFVGELLRHGARISRSNRHTDSGLPETLTVTGKVRYEDKEYDRPSALTGTQAETGPLC